MSRPVVIFVPAIDAFGGVERLIVDLSRFLHGKGQRHTVLCISQRIDLARHADWPLSVIPLVSRRNPLAEAAAFAAWLRTAEVQAPLIFDLKGAFYAGLAGLSGFTLHLTDPPSLLPADVSKFALTLDHHFALQASSLKKMHGEAVHQINRRGVRRAASLVCMTELIAGECETLYGRRAQIIRPGVQPPFSPPISKPHESSKLRFLTVSRLEANKRIDWTLRALAQMYTQWVLDIVGDGSQMIELRKLAAELQIEAQVAFHGRLSDEELERQFSKADVFLMPAIQGYGLPALEALSRGVPVVLHRQSGVSEILKDSPWVETLAGGPETMAAAIQRMVDTIRSGVLARYPRPVAPTAFEWAQAITAACGWDIDR